MGESSLILQDTFFSHCLFLSSYSVSVHIIQLFHFPAYLLIPKNELLKKKKTGWRDRCSGHQHPPPECLTSSSTLRLLQLPAAAPGRQCVVARALEVRCESSMEFLASTYAAGCVQRPRHLGRGPAAEDWYHSSSRLPTAIPSNKQPLKKIKTRISLQS